MCATFSAARLELHILLIPCIHVCSQLLGRVRFLILKFKALLETDRKDEREGERGRELSCFASLCARIDRQTSHVESDAKNV